MASESARKLRKEMNEYEQKLWTLLRQKRLAGFRFRRQHPIGPFIADFYCVPARLIVELDGAHHFTDEQIWYDARRTKWLEERGYRLMRITNFDVTKHPFDVLDAINRALRTPPSARQTSRRASPDATAGTFPQRGKGKSLGDCP